MICFKRLSQDEGGASIIELALVAPILATLLVGMVDLSRAYSYKLQLEQAAQRAIEKVQQYQSTTSTYGTLQTEAAAAAGVPATAVAIDYWLECDGTRASNYNSACASGQTYGRWVQVDITGTFTPMFRVRRWMGSNPDGTFTIHGKAGMRTQ
jgi:Flp pilus assembly protein TadG